MREREKTTVSNITDANTCRGGRIKREEDGVCERLASSLVPAEPTRVEVACTHEKHFARLIQAVAFLIRCNTNI